MEEIKIEISRLKLFFFWLIGGIFGWHYIYLDNITMAVIKGLTFNFFLLGWVYDFFVLEMLYREYINYSLQNTQSKEKKLKNSEQNPESTEKPVQSHHRIHEPSRSYEKTQRDNEPQKNFQAEENSYIPPFSLLRLLFFLAVFSLSVKTSLYWFEFFSKTVRIESLLRGYRSIFGFSRKKLFIFLYTLCQQIAIYITISIVSLLMDNAFNFTTGPKKALKINVLFYVLFNIINKSKGLILFKYKASILFAILQEFYRNKSSTRRVVRKGAIVRITIFLAGLLFAWTFFFVPLLASMKIGTERGVVSGVDILKTLWREGILKKMGFYIFKEWWCIINLMYRLGIDKTLFLVKKYPFCLSETFYDLRSLGIQTMEPSWEIVKKAYKAKIRLFHPDKSDSKDSKRRNEKTNEINRVYERLKKKFEPK